MSSARCPRHALILSPCHTLIPLRAAPSSLYPGETRFFTLRYSPFDEGFAKNNLFSAMCARRVFGILLIVRNSERTSTCRVLPSPSRWTPGDPSLQATLLAPAVVAPGDPPLLPAISIASFPPGALTTKSPRSASFSPLRAPRAFFLRLRVPRAFPLRLLNMLADGAARAKRTPRRNTPARQRASTSAHQRTIMFRRQSPLITSFLEARKRAEASYFGPLRSLPSARVYAA